MAPMRNTTKYQLAKIIDVRIAKNADGEEILVNPSLADKDEIKPDNNSKEENKGPQDTVMEDVSNQQNKD